MQRLGPALRQLELAILTQGSSNPRGNLSALQQLGSLERAAAALAPTDPGAPDKVLVLTGFPCIEAGPVHQETDGIAGAIAIARQLGPGRATIAIEHQAAFVVEEALRRIPGESQIEVLRLPAGAAEGRAGDDDWRRGLDAVGEYQLVCIEKAGPSADGLFRTMRARDISPLCAPEEVLNEIWGRAAAPVIAIGDGGNELGLGAVAPGIREHIPLGNEIACAERFSADICVLCNVSNVGGYALSLAVDAMQQATGQGASSGRLPNAASEQAIADVLQELGVGDGVSQSYEIQSVDGIGISEHIDFLHQMHAMMGRQEDGPI